MATLQIYYKNGNYEEIIPTSMQFGEGYLLQNDYIELEDIENKGIVWERSFFACEGDDEEKKNAGLMVRKVLVLDPATLGGVQAVVLNGNNCVFGSLEEEDDGEFSNEELEEIHEISTAIKEDKTTNQTATC